MKDGIVKDEKNPLEVGRGHGIIGGADFIEWIKETFLSAETSTREKPSLRHLMKRYTPDELIEKYVQLVGKSKEDICCRGKHSIERAMLMELLYRLCEITQTEIGRMVGGIDYSSVSQARSRLQRRIAQEPQIRGMFDELHNQLSEMSRSKI